MVRMIGFQRFANDTMRRLQLAIILLAFTVFAAEDPSEPAILPPAVVAAAEHRELESQHFNLKLYWQQGYRWQGSSSERKWCMKCRSNNCSDGTGIKIARCDKDDPRQQFYFDNRRIRSRKNNGMCLKRYGRYIALDGCDNSDSDQVWSNLRTDGGPFELQIPGNGSKCASQHHHPKDGEKVYMNSCKLAQRSTTDKWVVY